jgi:glycosyltransferase involved in cell wall biosynthesis
MASTRECLGNAIVESVMAGLPVITHSHVASRFVLGADNEWMCDLTKEGALRDRILELRSDTSAGERILKSQGRVRDLFSPEALAPRFYDMVMRVHGGGAVKTISNGAGA